MCLAVPGRILEINAADINFPVGRVSFGGVVKEVSLVCTPEARVDDFVMVHVGMALSIVDAAEAETVLGYLREMGELDGPAPPAAAS